MAASAPTEAVVLVLIFQLGSFQETIIVIDRFPYFALLMSTPNKSTNSTLKSKM